MVRRVTRTRKIVNTIKGTSKRLTFESVSAEEDGPTNEIFEAVEDKIPEASSTEVLYHVLGSAEEIVNVSEMTWSVTVLTKGRKDPRDSRASFKGELGGLLLFVHSG